MVPSSKCSKDVNDDEPSESVKKRRRRCCRHESRDSPAAHGGPYSLWDGVTQEQAFSEGTEAHGEEPCRAGGKCEEEGVAEESCYGLSTTPIVHPPFCAAPGQGRS